MITTIKQSSSVKGALSAPLAIAIATTLYALAITTTQAAPSLNQVVSGNAVVSHNAGDTTINQTTNNATIDWHSFNVAQNKTVTFNQPNHPVPHHQQHHRHQPLPDFRHHHRKRQNSSA